MGEDGGAGSLREDRVPPLAANIKNVHRPRSGAVSLDLGAISPVLGSAIADCSMGGCGLRRAG
jgi:hypothetical protein